MSGREGDADERIQHHGATTEAEEAHRERVGRAGEAAALAVRLMQLQRHMQAAAAQKSTHLQVSANSDTAMTNE